MNVMLDEGGIVTALESAPEACEKVWWETAGGGRRHAPRTDQEFLGELLTDAWEQRAPKRLLRG